MAAQPKRITVLGALAYMEDRIHDANRKLTIEADTSGQYDATYQAGLDASAKTDIVNVIKMLRWLKETYFGIAGTPAAFTDAEVDGINPYIRNDLIP